MLRPLLTTSLFTALLTSALPSSANLLSGGSFESPDIVATSSYQLVAHSAATMPGWTVVAPNPSDNKVQLTPDTYLGSLPAREGRQWLDLTGIYGYDKGVLSDSISVTPGTTYRIDFSVGNHYWFGRSTLGLSLNGGTEQLYLNTEVPSASQIMSWQDHSVLWVADSSTLALRFLGRANGANSNYGVIGLDAVSVTAAPVPEPSTLLQLAAGLLLLGALRSAAHGRAGRVPMKPQSTRSSIAPASVRPAS